MTRITRAALCAGWTLAGCGVLAAPATARMLEVGPGMPFPSPSAAARVAGPGDTVAIAPGTYFDCALWHASDLTISGTGPGVILTDRACAGKASFVISGDRVTVRGITFQRIRVHDGNGAGIRAEGRDLTVEDCSFVNDQFGILSGQRGGFLRISNSRFTADGDSLDGRPTHAIDVGTLDLLRVEHSSFGQARGGDDIHSMARHTELTADSFADDGGDAHGPLVMVFGGALTLADTRFDLSHGAADRPGAVLFVGHADALTVRGNTLQEARGHVPLLRNWTGIAPVASGNTVPPGTEAVSDAGSAYHRLRSRLASWRDGALQVARMARHLAGDVARAAHLIR